MPVDQATYTKPDIFSLEGLIEWLRGQDLDTEYDPYQTKDCLLTEYFREGPACDANGNGNYYHGVRVLDLPIMDVACGHPHTFGAALARAEALLEAKDD